MTVISSDRSFPNHLVEIPSTLSIAYTLRIEATVRFREVFTLERVHVSWYPNLETKTRAVLAVYNDHMKDRLTSVESY